MTKSNIVKGHDISTVVLLLDTRTQGRPYSTSLFENRGTPFCKFVIKHIVNIIFGQNCTFFMLQQSQGPTHQTAIKDLVQTKADCYVWAQEMHLNTPQKLQPTAADCIRHSKRETVRLKTADSQTVAMTEPIQHAIMFTKLV